MTTNSAPTPPIRATADSPVDTVTAIELHDVHRSFGDVRAVDGVDLTIRPGEIVALLGPNGAGKTSTIDMVLGLSRPDRGSVSVFGLTPHQAIARGLVSAVLQTGGLLKDLTVAETVAIVASVSTSPRPVTEVLERAGIADIAGRRVGKCSGGQQQRLRFAMSLVSDPLLVILDEPTTGMDVEGRRDFWGAIRADAELGRTVRATLPDADTADLARIPGVDSVARHLYLHTAAHDLEITSRNLEDAFIALTSDPRPGADATDTADTVPSSAVTTSGANR